MSGCIDRGTLSVAGRSGQLAGKPASAVVMPGGLETPAFFLARCCIDHTSVRGSRLDNPEMPETDACLCCGLYPARLLD